MSVTIKKHQTKVSPPSIGGKKAYINGIVFIALNYNEGYSDDEFSENCFGDLTLSTLAVAFGVSDSKVMNDVLFMRKKLARKGA